MNNKKTRILVVQTGESVEPALKRGRAFVPLFADALKEATVPVEVRSVDIRAYAQSDSPLALDDIDGVVVTGSSAMVGDDSPFIRYAIRNIKRIIDEDIPFLGVCFGHQLLGAALGADVGPNPNGRQMGSVVVNHDGKDPLLAGHPLTFHAQASHRDVIRDPGPRLSVVARASHDACHVVKMGDKTWGVQFHPEFTLDVMRDYLDARRETFDAERGDGAAMAQKDAAVDTPDARRTLASFAETSSAHRRERRGR